MIVGRSGANGRLHVENSVLSLRGGAAFLELGEAGPGSGTFTKYAKFLVEAIPNSFAALQIGSGHPGVGRGIAYG